MQSESSACWELRQIIRDAPFPLKDQNDAAEELERLAEQSDLHAQYLMGLLYRDGLLLIPDSQSAKYWLTQAAKQGLPEAQYALDKLLSLTILKSVIRTGHPLLERSSWEREPLCRLPAGQEVSQRRGCVKRCSQSHRAPHLVSGGGKPVCPVYAGKVVSDWAECSAGSGPGNSVVRQVR